MTQNDAINAMAVISHYKSEILDLFRYSPSPSTAWVDTQSRLILDVVNYSTCAIWVNIGFSRI